MAVVGLVFFCPYSYARNWCDDNEFLQAADYNYDSIVYDPIAGLWVMSSSGAANIECDLDDAATLSFNVSVQDSGGSPIAGLTVVELGRHTSLTISTVTEPGEEDTVSDNEFTSIPAPQINVAELGDIRGSGIQLTFTITLD